MPPYVSLAVVFRVIALLLFLLLALSSGGVISAALPWLLGGGLSALTASFLVP